MLRRGHVGERGIGQALPWIELQSLLGRRAGLHHGDGRLIRRIALAHRFGDQGVFRPSRGEPGLSLDHLAEKGGALGAEGVAV